MKSQSVEKLLHEIGFSPKEIEVYLALLEYDSLKVAEIARKVDIHRVALYEVLDQLTTKGVVSNYKQGRATYYSALTPKRLLTYLDREREEALERMNKQRAQIEKLLPQVESRRFKGTNKPKVQFFEGEKGMREAYEDTLSAHEPIVAYANVATMHEGLPNFFPKYYERRAANKIAIRAILPVNELSIDRAKRDQAELRQSRFLAEGLTFSPEVNIYNNKVLIASWQEQIAILIESKELADLQKTIFEQLWKSLPKHNYSLE